MTDTVTVTQADRNKAADLLACQGKPKLYTDEVREGGHDNGPTVQWFARAAHSGEGRSNGAGEDAGRRRSCDGHGFWLVEDSDERIPCPSCSTKVRRSLAALSAPPASDAGMREALSELWGIVHGCDPRLSVPMETIAKVRAALSQSEGAK